MQARALLLIFTAFAAGPGTLVPANAAPEPVPRVVTLAAAIELATHNNADLLAKLTVLSAADARRQQAEAASFPKVTGTAILSPIYAATGNALDSDNDLHHWGAWLQSSVTVLQPVYAWGKLSSLREAAARGIDVARAQARKDTGELIYDVKELYYGAVLTEQLTSFLEDGKKEVDDIVAKTEEDQKKKRPTISKRDYYRLKIFAAEANYRALEAAKLRFLARHALSLRLGFDPNEETAPQETVLVPIEGTPPAEEQLVTQMAAHRPEFAQLTNGILAKRSLLEAERTNKFPVFFVGGMLTFAYSNVRTGQQSAFAYDPYNRSTGGVGAGVQWTWDFATTLANEAAIRVEIDELERREIYAKAGFRMELKKVLANLSESRDRLAASRDAFQIGRRWLVAETMGYSIGLTEIKNLVDAYIARAKTAQDHWESVYRVNMGWAELSKTVGTEITPGLGPH
ncbi:MAG: TolC family protein [Deltaproteobacteria bacterium]|nr:TolC family protein [Deltaproteobacteria bacterium]